MTTHSVGGTQAVARSAALLREIAISEAGASLADLALRLELERPTAYRILQRLVVEGLLEQDPSTKRYTLGPLLYELGLAAKPPKYLQLHARDALISLARDSGDTVFAIAPTGNDSLCIDRQEGDYPVKALLMGVGRRRPLGVGAGSLALLSAMDPHKVQATLAHNRSRLQALGEDDLQELAAMVDQARSDGFVVRAPKEAPEILSLAVPVLNGYGSPVMALSISALHFRIERRRDALLRLLQQARQLIQ